MHFNKNYKTGLNYVYLKSNHKKLTFLVDTGATVSIIFKTYLSGNQTVKTAKEMEIKGIIR